MTLMRHKPATVTLFTLGKHKGFLDMNDTYQLWQEFDDYGNHRLCFESQTNASEWVSSRSIAALNVPNVGMFRGTSDYYTGVLPRVFQITMSLEDCLGMPIIKMECR